MAFLLSRALFSRHHHTHQLEHHRNDDTMASNVGGARREGQDRTVPSSATGQDTNRQERRRRRRRSHRDRRERGERRRNRRNGTSPTSTSSSPHDPSSVDINDMLGDSLDNIINFASSSKGPTPPASKEFMNSLIHLRIRNLSSLKRNSYSCPNETYAECSICAQPYQEKDVVCTLPCAGGGGEYCCSSSGGTAGGHMYHSDCIVDWLERKCTCPTCRCEFPTDDPVFEIQRRLRQQQQQQQQTIKQKEHPIERHEGSDDDDSTSMNGDGDNYGYQYHYQDDFMFLPPNLSVPVEDDEGQDSSSNASFTDSRSDDGSNSLSSSGSPTVVELNEDQHQHHEHRDHHHHHHHRHRDYRHRREGSDGNHLDDDFFHQNQNFDLIMRRVLRSKAKLRAQQQQELQHELQQRENL